MRFRKGICYPHPPRGPGRGRYRMSEAALRARRSNLRAAGNGGKVKRLRSDGETRIIKLLIWQWFFDPEPKPSQRAQARQLGVWPSYVWRVARKAHSAGWDALVKHGRRVTLDDLAEARRFTAKLREFEPGLLAPAPQPRPSDEPRYMTAEDIQREAQEMIRQAHRQNPGAQPRTMQEWQELKQRDGRRVLFSVPVR